jgi:post-segregation antitoxin (ccd killing protein)
MPKVSIYVPDALYDEVRRRSIPLSAVAQRAFEEAVRSERNKDWVDAARGRVPRTDRVIDTEALLDEVRDEFGS